jgi:hypothetical protein
MFLIRDYDSQSSSQGLTKRQAAKHDKEQSKLQQHQLALEYLEANEDLPDGLQIKKIPNKV